MTLFSRTVFAAAVLGGILVAPPAPAHQNATGVVKERMTMMEHTGKSVKALARVFKNPEDYDAERVARLAREIEERSGGHLTRLFPKGSLNHPSEATEDIWNDWQTFTRYADELQHVSGLLAARAGEGPDAAEEAFRTVVKACRGCHDDFRAD